MTTPLLLRIASIISLLFTVRPMIAVVALSHVGIGLIAWRFIFWVPMLFSAALALALALAWIAASASSIHQKS